MKDSSLARAKTFAEKLPDDNKLKEYAEKANESVGKAQEMLE